MFFNPVDNRWLYNTVDNSLRMMRPVSEYCLTFSKQLNRLSDTMNLPIHLPYLPKESHNFLLKDCRYLIRSIAGRFYVYHMLTDMYQKPEWGIEEVKINDNYIDVIKKIEDRKSFCNLLHFKKQLDSEKTDPKMLLVAPMSGHYATLLRDTVRSMLPYYDVYITDWKNARDVPLNEGSFDLDEYVEYLISYLRKLGPDCHVMAVCQATVPLLIALSIMSKENDPKLPLSSILLGGPIDTDQTPTKVNELATSRGDDWFKQNVISVVPSHYKGYMRLVYPGFMQLSGFMSMNLERHTDSLREAIKHYAKDDMDDAFKIISFYTEYFSTMDLTAEFYMQTINNVFQEKLLVKGKFKTRDHYANLKDIHSTAILAIEGGKDDITGIGQTKSVLNLCNRLPTHMKEYYLAEDVGHYGLFNGSKFRSTILPRIIEFTDALHVIKH